MSTNGMNTYGADCNHNDLKRLCSLCAVWSTISPFSTPLGLSQEVFPLRVIGNGGHQCVVLYAEAGERPGEVGEVQGRAGGQEIPLQHVACGGRGPWNVYDCAK